MMPKDTEYWQNIPALSNPLLYPNDNEIRQYARLSHGRGSVLLLGETPQLTDLCDEAVDLYPSGRLDRTFKGNWLNLEGRWGVALGDGCINLCGLQLVEALAACVDRLVVRVFDEWVHEWKYSIHFPVEFPGAAQVIDTRHGCRIVVWDFGGE